MLRPRLIPCLLLDGERLVKTKRFRDPQYVGDPINAIRIFNDKEVDELMLIDISASRLGRPPDFDLIEQLAGECFMPLCYGGGIRDAGDARRLYASGVEKVCLQSAFFERPELAREIADHAGEQAVVVSIDVEEAGGDRRLRKPGRGSVRYPGWEAAVVGAAAHGAGEILLNNASRDGTLAGLDLDLMRKAADLIEVPLVAAGGTNSLDDARAAVAAGASAVAIGAFFVFYGPHRAVLITYPTPNELADLWDNHFEQGRSE